MPPLLARLLGRGAPLDAKARVIRAWTGLLDFAALEIPIAGPLSAADGTPVPGAYLACGSPGMGCPTPRSSASCSPSSWRRGRRERCPWRPSTRAATPVAPLPRPGSGRSRATSPPEQEVARPPPSAAEEEAPRPERHARGHRPGPDDGRREPPSRRPRAASAGDGRPFDRDGRRGRATPWRSPSSAPTNRPHEEGERRPRRGAPHERCAAATPRARRARPIVCHSRRGAGRVAWRRGSRSRSAAIRGAAGRRVRQVDWLVVIVASRPAARSRAAAPRTEPVHRRLRADPDRSDRDERGTELRGRQQGVEDGAVDAASR